MSVCITCAEYCAAASGQVLTIHNLTPSLNDPHILVAVLACVSWPYLSVSLVHDVLASIC